MLDRKKLIKKLFIETTTLIEMPQFSDADKDLADTEKFEAPEDAKLIGTYSVIVPKFEGKSKIELYQYNASPESKEILLRLPSGEGVGVLSFDNPKESDLPFPTIMFSGVKPNYRGKGLSKILYDFVISKYKGLISDATLTGEAGVGSFQVWQSLNKKYKNIYVINTETGAITPVSAFTADMMGNHNERFMVTVNPFSPKNKTRLNESQNDKNKIGIYVDFDECLIHGFTVSDGKSPTYDEVKKDFTVSSIPDDNTSYAIVLRPGAKEFIKYLHSITPNIFILTAGLKDFQTRVAKEIGLLPLVKGLYGRDSTDVPTFQIPILIDDMWINSSNNIKKFSQMGVIDNETKEQADKGPWNRQSADELMKILTKHYIKINPFDATNKKDNGFAEILSKIKPLIDNLRAETEIR